ncbi:EamA family transporter [Rhizobium sp. PP-F2F-G48]|uniref:DMT family transporter n=1 Tax=Rhizobium sp. PP-F2F-G48 TaxID=2135651 RepID=UPI0014043ABD|nr:EamA family transporter [Rhizobium sp. PP-F2F-G48]
MAIDRQRGIRDRDAQTGSGQKAAYTYIALAALLFGLAGAMSKFLFNGSVDPLALTVLRTVIAAIVLMALFRVSGSWQKPGISDVPMLAAIGFLTFAVTYTFYEAIAEAGVATAIMLQYTAPVFVIVIEAAAFRKLPDRFRLLSITIALAGCFLLVRGYDFASLATGWAGIAFGLGCGLFFAAYNMLVTRAHDRGMAEQYITVYSFAFAALVALAVVPTIDLDPGSIDRSAWMSILFISIFATVLPYKLYVAGLKSVPAFQATLIGMLDPVSAALAAALFLGEELDALQVAGVALVIFAVLLTSHPSSFQHGTKNRGSASTPPEGRADPPDLPGAIRAEWVPPHRAENASISFTATLNCPDPHLLHDRLRRMVPSIADGFVAQGSSIRLTFSKGNAELRHADGSLSINVTGADAMICQSIKVAIVGALADLFVEPLSIRFGA